MEKEFTMTIKKVFAMAIAVLLLLSIIIHVQAQQNSTRIEEGGPALRFLEQAPFNACLKPHETGVSEYFIESGGLQRRFLLYVPAGYNSRHKIPVVFDLHGSTSFPEQELALSQTDILADHNGFAVIAPEGLDGFWNVPVDPAKPDDVQFISDVIDKVDALLCINTNRVYATGFSGGGRMVSQLGCDLPDRIAAIAPVGGLRFPAPCQDQIPVITFHGTADPINPYDGGGPDYWQTGVEEAIQGWSRHNGCFTKSDEQQISESVTRVKLLWCNYYNDVELYRIEEMGHQWPGSPLELDNDRFGTPSDAINATETMWNFFRRHWLHQPLA